GARATATSAAVQAMRSARRGMPLLRRARSRSGWQRERHDLRSRRRAQEAPATSRDNDVLAAVLAHERHRHAVRARVELGLPELLAGTRLERPEAAVDGRADDEKPARRRDAAAD